MRCRGIVEEEPVGMPLEGSGQTRDKRGTNEHGMVVVRQMVLWLRAKEWARPGRSKAACLVTPHASTTLDFARITLQLERGTAASVKWELVVSNNRNNTEFVPSHKRRISAKPGLGLAFTDCWPLKRPQTTPLEYCPAVCERICVCHVSGGR